MSDPARLAMAESSAAHWRSQADFYERMARTMSEALWQICVELQLPPQSEAALAGKTVLFGMYDIATITARVRALAVLSFSTATIPRGVRWDEPQEHPDGILPLEGLRIGATGPDEPQETPAQG